MRTCGYAAFDWRAVVCLARWRLPDGGACTLGSQGRVDKESDTVTTLSLEVQALKKEIARLEVRGHGLLCHHDLNRH